MSNRLRSLLRTLMYVGLIFIAVLIYAYGWKVTKINLDEPFEETRQKQVMRALQGILSPDLVERDQDSQYAQTIFMIPCGDQAPEVPEVDTSQPYIVLDPICGETKQIIWIEGFNFRAFSDGFVRWTPPGRSLRSIGRVKTDGEGHFRAQIRVPTIEDSLEPNLVETEVVWPVGKPRASTALKITIERMIETIFLALMATTLAILFAVPLSFIAAQNLMRAIRSPLGGLLIFIITMPFGWMLGRAGLQPVVDQSLALGNNGWWGGVGLIVLGALVYLWMRVSDRYALMDRPRKIWQIQVLRFAQLIVLAAVAVFAAGLVSGVGSRISLALGDFLAGILSNIIGQVSEMLGLLLPSLAGVLGVLILGSVVGTLMRALLDRLQSKALLRIIGILLGAAALGMLIYILYQGIYGFYNPNEPIPYHIYVGLGAALIGGVVGGVLGAGYNLPVGLIVYYASRTILNGLRSIEPLIMAIVFSIWVSIGPFAGVLALTLHSIAALGKLYSEQVESIDDGPIEAITATGATRIQTIMYAVVPQIFPPYIAFTLYRWDINVRMSTIIGFVGGGGIGFVLQQWINLLQYRQAGTAMFAIAIVVATLDFVSATMREKLV